ncbi:Brp/Blh family beta-carotene 15,15'-dioxygenase [Halocola ammonii]
MRKPLFYFISVFFLSLVLFPWLNTLPAELLDRLTITLIFILGVPHGAIDNILMKRRTGWSSSRFYLFYLGLITLNIGLWLILPAVALLLFLFISAYHFGQAQFKHHLKGNNVWNPLIYFSWGNLVLSFFFLFRREEIQSYFMDFSAYNQVAFIFDESTLQTFLLINGLLLLFSLSMSLTKKSIGIGSIGIETLILLMLVGISYLYHFLLGFGIFFVLLHAVPVILEEYKEFYSSFSWKNLQKFLMMLLPFTLLSLFGIFFLFALKRFELLDTTYLFLILLAGSSITLPHVWVMKRFYRE